MRKKRKRKGGKGREERGGRAREREREKVEGNKSYIWYVIESVMLWLCQFLEANIYLILRLCAHSIPVHI